MQPDSEGQGGNVQPTPGPDSGIPLVEGGNPAWNSVLQYVPEDKRNEVVPTLQEWDKYTQELNKNYEPFKDYDPENVKLALDVFNTIENNPQVVYETLGQYMERTGLKPSGQNQMTTEPVEPTDPTSTTENDALAGLENHPQFQQLKKQHDAMAQIILAKHQDEIKSQEQKQQDEALSNDLNSLKEKYGDFGAHGEKEIVMRMLHMGMSAEDAFKDYEETVAELRRGKPTPFILGRGGQVPNRNIDPKKLDSKGTKNLVVQMLEHAANE